LQTSTTFTSRRGLSCGHGVPVSLDIHVSPFFGQKDRAEESISIVTRALAETESANSIAQSAKDIARHERTISIIAAIAAIVAAIAAIVAAINAG